MLNGSKIVVSKPWRCCQGLTILDSRGFNSRNGALQMGFDMEIWLIKGLLVGFMGSGTKKTKLS